MQRGLRCVVLTSCAVFCAASGAGCHVLLPLEQTEERDGATRDQSFGDRVGEQAPETRAETGPGPDLGPCGGCDDHLPCTVDTCSKEGLCLHFHKPGFCAIDGACVPDRADNPQNPLCESCQAAKSPVAWTPDNGTDCDDNDPCTHTDRCSAGLCKGKSYSCTKDAAVLPCIKDQCTGGGPPPWGCDLVAGTCLIAGQCHGAASSGPNLWERCDPDVSGYSWLPTAGAVTTLAGSGISHTLKDHFGVEAQLSQPYALTVSTASGKTVLHVVEQDGCVVRRITAGAVVIAAGCG